MTSEYLKNIIFILKFITPVENVKFGEKTFLNDRKPKT